MDILSIHPKDLVNRYIAIYQIKQHYTPEQIKAINPDFTVDMFDENDKPVVELDLEYFFFVAENAVLKYG